jgi:hypothetical protein
MAAEDECRAGAEAWLSYVAAGTHPAVSRGVEFLLDHDDVRAELVAYAPVIVADSMPGLGIQVDDLSAIPLVEQLPMAAALQLRARLRARSGDAVLSNFEPPGGYESYNADRLGLGRATWLQASSDRQSMTVTRDCLANPACLDTLADLVRDTGGHVHPYISSEDVWLLARELSGRSGSNVSVVGPPPALTALVNNKRRFLEFARVVAGPDATIPFAAADNANAVAALLRQLSHRAGRLVVRLPGSAAGLGTRVVDTASFPAEQDHLPEVDAMLAGLGWDGRTEVLVSEWTESLTSVSTQVWIPPARLGLPTCEGVYEQRLDPHTGMQFWGAQPVRLANQVDAELRRLSLLVCTALQRAGYVGRCSFDFLLVGKQLASATPIFVECNGRWGGVSLVMSFVDRVSPARSRAAHSFGPVVQDSLRGADFEDVLETLQDELYEARNRAEPGVLLYNVGALAVGRIDICAVDTDQDSAVDRWERCANRLQAGAR